MRVFSKIEWFGLLFAAAHLFVACESERERNVVVGVELSEPRPDLPIASLRVTVDSAERSASRDYPALEGASIEFPTEFTMGFRRIPASPVRLEVKALDFEGAVQARAVRNNVVLFDRDEAARITLFLACLGTCSGEGDLGPPLSPGNDAGAPDSDAELCGNGQLDSGETCDVAIDGNQPGACPESCDDAIACTIDSRVGARCSQKCVHQEIRVSDPGDLCCPSGATAESDPDCSNACGNGVVDEGETCDTAIAAGNPGFCETLQTCKAPSACVFTDLYSAGTCHALCVATGIVQRRSGDSCCPDGADWKVDNDCPVVCGNGSIDDNEKCDPGSDPGCETCDDGDACTTDGKRGVACDTTCVFTPIATLIDGDGCCPAGAHGALDSDCEPTCGNGILEPGESCDPAILRGQPGACPTACAQSACFSNVLQGQAAECSARCVREEEVTACRPGFTDGCCPSGCTARNDADCSDSCGNGFVEEGETCDVAVVFGAGACNSTCPAAEACVSSWLQSEGTCQATCLQVPIERSGPEDGCCLPGAIHSEDPDCAPTCGDGRVDKPSEACDSAIALGELGSCPVRCPQAVGCTAYEIVGNSESCTAACEARTIEACRNGDDCCPAGCSEQTDSDCKPICGNGRLDSGESCDPGIKAGNPGACEAQCETSDACVLSFPQGASTECTRRCVTKEVTACRSGDGCCPLGCGPATDGDCAPICGNGIRDDGEFCDPPSSCPTRCEDDGDSCTRTELVGEAATCSAHCVHEPIETCGGEADGCCPQGCAPDSDPDCDANP